MTDGDLIRIIPARREIKYLIPAHRVEPIRRALAGWCRLDEHCASTPRNRYSISSLYLDSANLEFHRAKVEGAPDRIKLRVRTYGDPAGGVFAEVKRKRHDVIHKTRARLDADWRMSLVEPSRRDTDDRNRALFRSHLDRFGARPTLLSRYEREAWESVVDDYARVTFDFRLEFQPCDDWDLSGADNQWRSADDATSVRSTSSLVVLELKFAGAPPRWMTSLVDAFEPQRTGFSKYCVGVEHLFSRDRFFRPGLREAVF